MFQTITARIITVVASALLLAGCASAPTAERGPAPDIDVTVDEAAAAFRELAFTRRDGRRGVGYEFLFAEYERSRRERENKLIKWPPGSVLRIHDEGSTLMEVRPYIRESMDDLSKLTGIPYVFDIKRNKANFIVNVEIEEKEALQCGAMGVVKRYRPRPGRYDSYLERPPFTLYGFGISQDSDDENCCISHVLYRRTYGRRPIAYTHLSIDNLPSEQARSCTLAHYGRAMGFNLTEEPIDSCLSTRSGHNEPTQLDKLLMWTLYDPRLKDGMSREEAMPIVRQILTEALGEGAEAETQNNS